MPRSRNSDEKLIVKEYELTERWVTEEVSQRAQRGFQIVGEPRVERSRMGTQVTFYFEKVEVKGK